MDRKQALRSAALARLPQPEPRQQPDDRSVPCAQCGGVRFANTLDADGVCTDCRPIRSEIYRPPWER